jgi:hypothetical protein
MSDVRLIIKVCYELHRRGDITVPLTVLEFMDYEQENNTRKQSIYGPYAGNQEIQKRRTAPVTD